MTQRPDTQSAILEAAFLVFGRDPSASLALVAREAGVGRATLHRHFSGRDDLLAAMTRLAVRELDDAVETATKDAASDSEALQLALSAMVPLGPRQWFLNHEAAEGESDLAELLASDRKEFLTAIEAAKAEGTFAPHIPVEWIAEAYDALLYMAWTLVRKEEATARQAADFAWKMLVAGGRT